MIRRVWAVVLAAAGGFGLLTAPRLIPVASVRNAVVVLLIGELLVCCVAVLRRSLSVRPAVRWLALAVALIFAAGAAAIRQRIATEALASVPEADLELRTVLADWVGSLPWLAGALVCCGLAILALPGARGAATLPPADMPGGAAADRPAGATPEPPPAAE